MVDTDAVKYDGKAVTSRGHVLCFIEGIVLGKEF